MDTNLSFNPEKANLYVFGDSFNDPGQYYEIRAKSEDFDLDELNIPVASPTDPSFAKTIKVRGVNARACDGSVQATAAAKLLGMQHYAGFKIQSLPEGSGHLINFALSGAAQVNNTNLFFDPSKPEESCGIDFQIGRLQTFLEVGSRTLHPGDVCMVQSSFNDIFMLFQQTLGNKGNLGQVFTTERYVAAAVDNVSKLVGLGCKQVVVQVLSKLSVLNTKNWSILDEANPGVLKQMDAAIDRMQKELVEALGEKGKEWSHVKIWTIDASEWWVRTQENMTVDTTLVDEGWPKLTGEQRPDIFFFDYTHPSAAAHAKHAQMLVDRLTEK